MEIKNLIIVALSTHPSNFLPCAQVDTKIFMRPSIDEPCMFEASKNFKKELTGKNYFWLMLKHWLILRSYNNIEVDTYS